MFAGTGKDTGEVFRTTRGNPFYVTELLNSADEALPPNIQDAVLVRADRLQPEARKFLDAVSIFPRRAGIETVGALIGSDFRAGLNTCLSHGLLQIDGAHVGFRHELARQAVETALPWSERKTLHKQALHQLQLQPDIAKSALLHHARQSGDQSDVHDLARDAAQEPERLGSNREAAEYYRVAVEAAGDLLHADRAELYARCAWSYYMVGRFLLAIDIQKRALRLLKASNDPVREGDGYRKLSRYQWTGSTTRANSGKSAAKAVEILSDLPGRELAMAHSTMAQLAMLKWEFETAIPFAEQAIAYASTHGHKDILSDAYNNLAGSLRWEDPDRIRYLFGASIALACEIGDWDDAARGYTNWSEIEYLLQDDARGCVLADQGLALCQEHELDGFLRYLSGIKA